MWTLFFPSSSLEVIRARSGWWTFALPSFDRISYFLQFITCFGLIGLVIAGIINWSICRRKEYSVLNAAVAFISAFFLNKVFIGDLLFFEPYNDLFVNYNMHIYFLTNLTLAFLFGTIFLLFPLYLRYFKFANPGGVRWRMPLLPWFISHQQF